MDTKSKENSAAVGINKPEGVTMEKESTADETITTEEFKVSGDELVARVKALIHQGNIRRIMIKNETGYTLFEIPLTVGVIGGAVGAVFFPVIAALGVIGAMVTHLTMVVERQGTSQSHDADQS